MMERTHFLQDYWFGITESFILIIIYFLLLLLLLFKLVYFIEQYALLLKFGGTVIWPQAYWKTQLETFSYACFHSTFWFYPKAINIINEGSNSSPRKHVLTPRSD